MAVMFICPARDGHHVGQLCPVCGQDERHLGGVRNPEWKGYTLEEFAKRWAITASATPRWEDKAWEVHLTRKHPLVNPPAELVVLDVRGDTPPTSAETLAFLNHSRYKSAVGFELFLGPLAWSEFTTEVRL